MLFFLPIEHPGLLESAVRSCCWAERLRQAELAWVGVGRARGRLNWRAKGLPDRGEMFVLFVVVALVAPLLWLIGGVAESGVVVVGLRTISRF